MKTLTRVVVCLALGAAAPAQVPDPQQELAAVIAVEEHERDLGKAEALYRERLAGTTLSAKGRALAQLRLGRLLQRLGRDAEAQPLLDEAAKSGLAVAEPAKGQGQDVAREAELRSKAREVLARIEAQRKAAKPGRQGFVPGRYFGFYEQQDVDDLLWLGEAAVPEIAALLESRSTFAGELTDDNWWLNTGLASLLWGIGGQRSTAFLREVAKSPELQYRRAVARGAYAAATPLMIKVAEQWLLDQDPEGEVPLYVIGQIGSPGQPMPAQPGMIAEPHPMFRQFDVGVLVDLALTGKPRVREYVIQLLGSRWNQLKHDNKPEESLDRFLPHLRKALAETDPRIGQAAQAFLVSNAILASEAGRNLLLEQLPRMSEQMVRSRGVPGSLEVPYGHMHAEQCVQAAEALGQIVVNGPNTLRQQYLGMFVEYAARTWNAKAMQAVLRLVELGYDGLSNSALAMVFAQHAEDAHLRQAVALLPLFKQPHYVLPRYAKLDLDESQFPVLRDVANRLQGEGTWVLVPLAGTGAPGVVDCLRDYLAKGGGPRVAFDAAYRLVARKDTKPARALLRELLAHVDLRAEVERWRSGMILLARVGDPRIVDLLPEDAWLTQNDQQSWWRGGKVDYPLQGDTATLAEFLLRAPSADRMAPGYDAATHSAVVAKMVLTTKDQLWKVFGQVLQANEQAVLPPAVTAALLRGALAAYSEQPEADVVIRRLVPRQPVADPQVLDAFRSVLRCEDPAVRRLCEHFGDAAVRALRAEFTEMLRDPVWTVAATASQRLQNAGRAPDPSWALERLASKDSSVRVGAVNFLHARLGKDAMNHVLPLANDVDWSVQVAVADYLASALDPDTVPALLQLARSPWQQVREKAEATLKSIRFLEDQQAHWRRIQKGLDTSAASAAEKLLLQSKPGAPKEQRLLAVRSLGALGAPESLPFLIDWMADPDQEIAAAVRAAITQIHQKAGAK